MFYDVAIIGAGPAGSILANRLSLNGFSVILLEKHKLPRSKPCAGGVTLKAKKILDTILQENIFECEINRAIISYRSLKSIEKKTEDYICWTSQRRDLDYAMCLKAKEAGAIICDSEAISDFNINDEFVEIITTRKKFKTKILVGADGVNSFVARKINITNFIEKGIAWECELKVSVEILEKHNKTITMDFGDIPEGYAWIFPKKNHFSVGVYSSNLKTKNLKKLLFEFLKKQNLFYEDYDMTIRSHLLPLGGKKYPVLLNRVLLVGDAGGLADSYLGEGIYYALRSGEIASECIEKFLKNESGLDEYQTRINKEIILDLAHSRMLAYLTYLWPWMSYEILSRKENVSKIIIDLIKGDMRYSNLLGYFKPLARRIKIFPQDI